MPAITLKLTYSEALALAAILDPLEGTDAGAIGVILTKIAASIGADAPVSSTRPGDAAAVYARETGVDYATALVHCNMD